MAGVMDFWRWLFTRAATSCPVCDGGRVASILYGYPASWMDLPVSHDHAVHGGCVFSRESPTAMCLDCRHKWQDPGRSLPW